MQREISIAGHERPTISAASPPFSGNHSFAASIYPSIFPPTHPSLLDYLNDCSSLIPPSNDALGPCSPRIQQQQLHQDLMDRHQKVLFHLRDVAKEAQSLRQENVNLKMANLDLNNRLNSLVNSSQFNGVDLGPGLDSLLDGLQKMNIGMEEERAIENESVTKSPTSVMDSGRVGREGAERLHLPKSISVRSSGYLKAARDGGSSGKGRDCVKVSKQNKIDNGTVHFALYYPVYMLLLSVLRYMK